MFNNLFLTTACLTVFIGTLYPLALEAITGEKISVGAPFFNLTFGPLFVALMFAMPFGPLLAWKRGDLLGVAQRLVTVLAIRIIAVAAVFAVEGGQSALAPFGVGLALFVMVGALIDLIERTGLFRLPLAMVLARAVRIAALSLGNGVCSFRHRRVNARHHLRGHLGNRTHRRSEADADRFPFRLRTYL